MKSTAPTFCISNGFLPSCRTYSLTAKTSSTFLCMDLLGLTFIVVEEGDFTSKYSDSLQYDVLRVGNFQCGGCGAFCFVN